METAVAKKLPAASILNLGRLPDHLKLYRNAIPTLMHGSKIEFGTIFSSKNYNITRHIYYPLVMFRPLYSRALDLVIWTRISDVALKNLTESGGFDEYIISVDPKYIECTIAAMLRRKIAQVYYSDIKQAEEVLRQTTEKHFYLKHVDKDAVYKEKMRSKIPPEGKLSSIRERIYGLTSIFYGNEYADKLKESLKIFDSHLAYTARKEILEDPVLAAFRKSKEEWKIELSGEIDFKEFKCDKFEDY